MPDWWLTKDGDRNVLAIYERHYSAYRYRDGRVRSLFMGPGEKIVLRTKDADAAFGWKKFRDGSGQQGINCSFFRNEGPLRSSDLIRQADAIADVIWPNSRHYTYVSAEKVRSKNPGYCFIKAGWRRCGRTKGGLVILERVAREVEELTKMTPKRDATTHKCDSCNEPTMEPGICFRCWDRYYGFEEPPLTREQLASFQPARVTQ